MEPDIDSLVHLLKKYSDQYYNSGSCEVSDAEFDALETELRTVDPYNSYFLGVGSEVRTDKVDLPIKMGSLDQLHDKKDIELWTKKFNSPVVISSKLDGVSLLLAYDNKGNLTKAYTRGDGIQGQDVTRHVNKIQRFTPNFYNNKHKKSFLLRAEIILEKKAFEQLNDITKEKYGETFKNARNFVAGQINKKIAFDEFYESVDIIPYQVIGLELDKSDQFIMISNAGLRVPNFFTCVNDKKYLCEEHLKKLIEEFKGKSPYELDGVVIDVDKYEHCTRLESNRISSSINPTYSRKFKVLSEDNFASTKVVNIHWNISKWGYLKPQVEIEPVDLMGVTITYATGFNAKFINDNKLGIGSEVEIVRSGDVIPFIKKVVSGTGAILPDFEEFGEWEWNETNVDIILKDCDNIPEVRFQRMLDFVTSLEIPLLKESNLRVLFDNGIDDVPTLIKASKSIFMTYIGAVIGKKIHEGIKKVLNPVQPHLLAGSTHYFGRGIGVRKLEKIFEKYPNTDDWNLNTLLGIEGIAKKSAEEVLNGLEAYKTFLDDIRGYYVFGVPAKKSQTQASSDKCLGWKVVFTDVRDEAMEEYLKLNGAEICSGVSKKTTHLIVKDMHTTHTTKRKKAEGLGTVKIIGYEEAIDLFELTGESTEASQIPSQIQQVSETQKTSRNLIDLFV